MECAGRISPFPPPPIIAFTSLSDSHQVLKYVHVPCKVFTSCAHVMNRLFMLTNIEGQSLWDASICCMHVRILGALFLMNALVVHEVVLE